MRKRGEITVFLSLVIVCVMSLILGLLESARTAGARLYGQMAADSAMASVMSQYNKNLWEMYHLLFLETESEEAVAESFSKYLNDYMNQKNWYPMQLEEVNVTGMTSMVEDGGVWLEDGALSYVKYRLPDVAGDMAGIAEDAANASKAGDVRELFEVCRQAGRRTGRLEKKRMQVEDSVFEMWELCSELEDAVDSESQGRFENRAGKLKREIGRFPGLVDEYEAEVHKISEYKNEIEDRIGNDDSDDMDREVMAYAQVEEAAIRQLLDYRETETAFEQNLELLEEALDVLEEEVYEEVDGELVPVGPDWGEVGSLVSEIEIPGGDSDRSVDMEKVALLDQLEEVFQGDLLNLVLPQGVSVSKRSVSLSGVPSQRVSLGRVSPERVSLGSVSSESVSLKSAEETGNLMEDILKKIMVNEYCFLKFDSFMKSCEPNVEAEDQKILYEVEYLLCGNASDRENLYETVEQLLTVRGAMNLLYLFGSPERKAEADGFAAAVTGGNAAFMVILSFFILTMWALGEAVWDVKLLLNGQSVPFWKNSKQWNLELEELFAFQFLEPAPADCGEGKDYTDHMRVLFFLMDREERNFRMMDVIQWNVRTLQEDFAVEDCFCKVDIEADIREQHVFFIKNEYRRILKATGSYSV